MMTCQDATQRMADLLDGHLPAGQRLALWLHVKICPPCARYLQQLRLTAQTLQHLRRDETPPDPLRDDLLDAFRKRNTPQEPS